MKRKVNCGELCVEKTLLGLPHTVEGRLWTTAKSTRKSEVRLCEVFLTRALLREVMPNVNFALFSKNKDQLRDLYNYLNQKVITTINTLDGPKLVYNLITNHQVDYISSALILAEAVENTRGYLVANKVGSITLLV